MNWTPKKIEMLRELCFKELPNKEIAKRLGCDVKHIHAKRSQLGITRDKVKTANRLRPITPISHRDDSVNEAFDELHKVLLLVIAYDGTSEKDAKLYSCIAETVNGLQGVLAAAMSKK